MLLICLIDDDPTYHFISTRLISTLGIPHTLLQFYDGAEALEYFTANRSNASLLPDLVLLDINMPYLDGWQFLDEMAEVELTKSNMTIYMCSSSDSSFDCEKATTYDNVTGYLRKPLTRDKLLEIIHKLPK